VPKIQAYRFCYAGLEQSRQKQLIHSGSMRKIEKAYGGAERAKQKNKQFAHHPKLPSHSIHKT